MPESSSRSAASILWSVLRACVYVVLGGVVLFFALTRTEVGRNGIRQQLQSSFNDQFAGRLQIGSLEGTLLNQLRASDVRLRDGDGQLVASVDSVSAEPDWQHLLTGELSIHSLTLVRPHLRLHRHADGTWNAQRALTSQPSDAASRPLDLSFSNFRVRSGQITTTRAGDSPSLVADRWLFDYTQSEVDQINGQGTLEWASDRRLVNLNTLQFHLPESDLTLQSAQAELTGRGERWELNNFSAQLGNTRLDAQGTLLPSPRDSAESVLEVELAESRLDHDQLHRLVPRLPLRDTVTVEGRVGGSLNRLVANELTVAHEQSAVTVEGTALGLPDSLDVDAQIRDSQVRPTDVRAVWPTAPLDPAVATGPVQLDASLQGTVQKLAQARPSFDLEGSLSALGAPGALEGSFDVRRTEQSPLQYDGQVQVDSLDLAPLLATSRLQSDLTGQIQVQGAGTRFSTLRGTLNASLSSSRVGSRSLSAATLQVTADQRTIAGDFFFEQPSGGILRAEGTLDATDQTPRFDATTSTRDFDLAAAHPSLPPSRLDATLALDGQGRTWKHLTGMLEVDVDSSRLLRAGETVHLPPHQTTLTLSPPSSAPPRLQLTGTLASGQVEGRVLHPTVVESGRLWRETLLRTVRHELAEGTRTPPDTASARATARPTALERDAERAFDQSEVEAPVELRGDLTLHRMDLLKKWWPRAPREGDDLHTAATLVLGPDTLKASGSVSAPRLQIGNRRADSVDVSYGLSGPLQASFLDEFTASISAEADTLRFGNRSLTAPRAALSLAHRTGTVEAQVEQFERTGPFRLTSDVRLQEGLHFQISELHADVGQDVWSTRQTGSLSLYSDALVVDSLQLSSPRPHVESSQHLRVDGAVSSAPSDTLHADMTDVLLYPAGELASLPHPLGGRVNGRIGLTGGWTQPQVRSNFRVHRLSYDRRVLGDLHLRSRLTSQSPDLLVDAALSPGPDSRSSLEGPELVPGGPDTIEKNRLQAEGRVRLPGWESSPSPSEQLDLTVDVQRADLFFFRYIFDENVARATGYTEGRIHVGGHFRHPIFDADLDIHDGHFALPDFGLTYTANGPVRVDREGIHLQDLSVQDDAGSAVVRGSVLFNEYRYFSFDLSADLDEITIIDVADAEDLAFYGTIRASGTASLTGPLQDATLRSEEARTTPDSELYIPVSEEGVEDGTGFIVFADSTGQIPDLRDLTRRDNILSDRPAGEPSFLEGLEIDINVVAPEESTVHLVFDPVVGDVVTAVGSGRVQLQRQEGEFFVYGNYNVSGGTYLFTAGEVFVRRFSINQGTIRWDGPPTNAQLNLEAEYRTRASPTGLPGYSGNEGRIPVRVLLDIGGRVETPRVDLRLARVRDQRNNLVGSQTLDAILNQSERTTEYATSVLLTNTFLLTTESFTEGQTAGTETSSSGNLATAGNRLAFNSVSQLVASQLNRYLGAALPNVDLNFGLQGEDTTDLDLIYGVALRLLNERLVIRGEGVYTGEDPSNRQSPGAQGEFVVEVRLTNRVSVEAFYRRTGDELTQGQTLTSSTGAGISYQSEFPSWRRLIGRAFGWLIPSLRVPDRDAPPEAPDDEDADPVARREEDSASPPESPDG